MPTVVVDSDGRNFNRPEIILTSIFDGKFLDDE